MAMLIVNGVTLKSPSSFTWSLQDVSASDAGRTTDALMHKNRVTSKRKIQLSWNGCSPSEASAILSAFQPEYVSVTYFDPLIGDTTTKTFYSGDKSAPVKVWNVNNKYYSSIDFDIIER